MSSVKVSFSLLELSFPLFDKAATFLSPLLPFWLLPLLLSLLLSRMVSFRAASCAFRSDHWPNGSQPVRTPWHVILSFRMREWWGQPNSRTTLTNCFFSPNTQSWVVHVALDSVRSKCIAIWSFSLTDFFVKSNPTWHNPFCNHKLVPTSCFWSFPWPEFKMKTWCYCTKTWLKQTLPTTQHIEDPSSEGIFHGRQPHMCSASCRWERESEWSSNLVI